MGFTAPHLRLNSICIAVILLITMGLAAPVAHADDQGDFILPNAPLAVRSLSPVLQLYGVPRMSGARLLRNEKQFSFNIEAANNFQSDNREGTFVFFDGETLVTSARLRSSLGDRFEWGFEIPYVAHTGGAFDGVVDEFHELFGLPDGERSLAPRGRLDFLIRSDGVVYADFNDSVKSLGDVRGFLGYQFLERPNQAFAIRGQLKLPTGRVDKLSGSEGTDVSLWAEYEYDLASKILDAKLTLSGGISYLGRGELIPDDQVTWLGFGHLGLQIPLHPRVDFIAQLDAHTDVLSTGNPLIADAGVLGTIGGRIGLSRRWWLDLAIIEDLEAESATDVVFQILLGSRF